MRKQKFTKGPWTVMNQGAIWLIYGFMAERVARVMIMVNGGERKANAALISTSPELLYALEMVYNSLPSKRDWLDPDIESYMKATIAKAYGETP